MAYPGAVAIGFVAATCCACGIETSGLAGSDAAVLPDATVRPADAEGRDVGPSLDGFVPETDAGETVGDAGGPIDFRDLAWSRPEPLSGTSDPGRCETDPVVTSDMRWLFLSRPEAEGPECYLDREFHLFRWNGGAPEHVARIGRFDPTRGESNPHPLDGAFAGRPGDILFFFSAAVPDREIMAAWLSGDPPAATGTVIEIDILNTPGSDSDPTMTVPGDRLIIARDGDLFETNGSPPTGYPEAWRLTDLSSAEAELDPAVSADGRVLVFGRRGASTVDLWVARRDDPTSSFAAPAPLSVGGGEINTAANDEMDPFITAQGDLLFMSNRSGTPRLYIAPKIAP